MIRNDRKNKEGGGVCFYVHDLVTTLPAPDLNIDGVVTLRIKNTVLILVYHPTSYSLSETEEMVGALDLKIGEILEREESVVLLGYFNLPDLDWDNAIINGPPGSKDEKYRQQQLFLQLFLDHGLTWNHGNDFVTRKRNSQESTLDNILPSDEALVSPSQAIRRLGKSDHIGILCNLALSHNVYTTATKNSGTNFHPKKL